MQTKLVQKKIKTFVKEQAEFIMGNVCQTIPEYLIENPESKIAVLNIDLNDYESTITALEFLYPRLIRHGILILENYSNNNAEKSAVDDYFAPAILVINCFTTNSGSYYMIKE